MLTPATLTHDPSGHVVLGSVSADWLQTQEGASAAPHLSQHVLVPFAASAGVAPLEPEARLALELLTAYRLHVQADQFATAGVSAKAAAALTTSALRLRSAGDIRRANEAQQAASSLLASLADGPTAALRAKYAVRNQSMFHHLRRALRTRIADSAGS